MSGMLQQTQKMASIERAEILMIGLFYVYDVKSENG